VVFENHVFIFSDKQCKFPNSGDIRTDWSRWYKRAVRDSANQIYGAERWIFNFPDRIYIDSQCSQRFPFQIPPKQDAIIHRIVVSHGASESCIKQLGGTGSLMICPQIIGDMHINSRENICDPFAIGQINPQKGFVHVLDDTSLVAVMSTLDTISDFTRYLTKKEELIKCGKLIVAAGEDDLLAYYLRVTDEEGNHTFIPSEGEEKIDAIAIEEGFWEGYCKHPARLAQTKANEISYSWDRLIEKFIFHITTGTSYSLSHPDLKSQEMLLRFLAREDRTRRRFLAERLNELIENTPDNYRIARTLLPTKQGEPYYVFLLLPHDKTVSDETYREVRMGMLAAHIRIIKHRYPPATDIIGLATETGLYEDRTEDLQYHDARVWTKEDEEEAIQFERDFKDMLVKRRVFRSNIDEYPNDESSKITFGMKGSERNKPCPCRSGKKFKHCCGRNLI
jgi:hypothetical protein